MIWDVLEKNKSLERNAVICGEIKVSYSELYSRSTALGEVIKKDNTNTVILFMPNCINYVVAFFAIHFSQKVVYPISSHSKEDELASAINRSGARMVICTKETYAVAKEMDTKEQVSIICLDDSGASKYFECSDYEAGIQEMKYEYSVLLNTSGSTDIHKIVMLTEDGLMTNCKDWVKAALDPSEAGRILLAMPASTSFGTVVMITCIMLGWTIVFLPSFFNTATLLKTVSAEKVSHLICIGSMLNIIAKSIAGLAPREEFNCLKFIGTGGNKAVPETLKAIMNFFPNAGISPGYGLTEATCIVSSIHPKMSLEDRELFFKKIESAGIPFENSNVSISNDGKGAGVIGEVLVSGPTIMKGYLNNSQATKEALADDVLHTGDMGYFDEDGYLYLVGRSKNIIKSGGYTVFPEEVEAVIQSMEVVKEAYVYGVVDPIIDEKIVADIITIDGSALDILELQDYCFNHLAKYKVPESINIVTEIAKTKTGKIQRKVYKSNEQN